MSMPRVVSPEEGMKAVRRATDGIYPSYTELAHTVATEPERIEAARVESYNQGYVEGYEKASSEEGKRNRTTGAPEAQQTPEGAERSRELTTEDDR
jgi:hypothetical protein